MGFLEQLLGGLTSKDGQPQEGQQGQHGQHAALYEQVTKLVSQSGGIGGLVQQLQQKGLGELVSGWISNGPNPPISGEQVVQALGREKIMSIASAVGLSEEQVTNGITKLLPVIIDKLTPGGKTPTNQAPADTENALNTLKSKIVGS